MNSLFSILVSCTCTMVKAALLEKLFFFLDLLVELMSLFCLARLWHCGEHFLSDDEEGLTSYARRYLLRLGGRSRTTLFG